MRRREKRGPLESHRADSSALDWLLVAGTLLAPFIGGGFLFGLMIFWVIVACGGMLGFMACWGLGCIFTLGLWGITR